MVYNIPNVRVSHTYGYTPSIPADDQLSGYVVESIKGEPNKAVLIRSAEQLYQEFKVRLDAYFGVGGQAFYVTRAACDTANPPSTGTAPVKASHTLKDTTGTPVNVLNLVAKQKGTYDIFITVSQNVTGGNNIIIEEEGYPTEYYIGITGIENMVTRINRESEIVDATFTAEGTGILANVARIKLGTGFTVGTNGTVNGTQAYPGQLPDANAPTAHAKALASLEAYQIAAVFNTQATSGSAAALHAKYVEHIDKVNGPEYHGWRFAILGAPAGASKSSIIGSAVGFNRENVVYVGQGVIDINGTEYSPCQATQVIAGKIGATKYYETIWGGAKSKVLGIEGEKYIAELVALPGAGVDGLATKEDIIEYNEKGVTTFVEELDGIRIREGVTTIQDSVSNSSEDELAVVRIIRHAKYLVYNRAYEMLGQNITATYKTDLEEHIKTGLEVMKSTDLSLIDITESGLSAYTVSVQLVPRTVQKQGKVTVNVTITPVHAAREISAQVVVM